MIHFVFTEKDLRYLFLKFDDKNDEKNLRKLKDHINLIDPICYLPTYTGIPYTQDFIWEYTQASGQKIYYCSIGLWQVIYKFFKENDIAFDGLLENKHLLKHDLKHSFEEFKDIVDSWGLDRTPRPYQYEAAYKILQWNSSVSQLATRAGKTLIAYIVFRYAMEYMGVKNILMIVPSIDLVKQAYNDFNEYAEFFKTECVWGGGKLVESSNLTVGTFQSLIKFIEKPKRGKTNNKYNPQFFDKFDCVFVDETHRASAAQIKTIISQPFMQKKKLAFGMTGTLPKEKTIEFYCIHSLLGAKIQEIRPKELMDAGYISPVNIKQIRLFYQNIEKQKEIFIKCAEYAISEFNTQKDAKGRNVRIPLEHPEYQIQYVKTLPYMVQQVKATLYQQNEPYKATDKYIQYLKDLHMIIKERFPNRHIAIITGSVQAKKRDQIKQLLKENNDCILIGSYGCMSTGITLNNLCYGVLFESFKSMVVNMQSIGRGLGLKELANEYTLYDIIDCFSPAVTPKKIYLQGLAKTKIYTEEKYPYKIIDVNL